jgi:pimeloyl-ACP methyl ester carboxylesterase
MILATVLTSLALVQPAQAETPQTGPDANAQGMDKARATIRDLRTIVTPQGIAEDRTVRIGGIDQYISIRGSDRRNPVLLILHGGPGDVELPMSWWNTRELEEYFTVIEWDQRGAGKTYLINDPAAVAPTMTPERFVQDTEELVTWLRGDLGKSKIFLLGHSWGSYVGLEFAKRHPEWLHAYIGTGQFANSPESERRGWAFAMQQAKATGNAEAQKELQSIAPYAAPGKAIPLKDIMLERKWSDFFGGVMAYRTHQTDGAAADLSPDYAAAETPHVWDGNGFSEKHLISAVLTADASGTKALRCPLILLEGRHDKTVNSDVAHEWFDKVKAPEKHFVWFEHSAHEVMAEEPGKVLVSLEKYALPIARRNGDGVR